MTVVPSVFRSLSKNEADELQQKLAGLSPEEFRNQLQSKLALDQPPLWLGPYTEPVVADVFGLLNSERAAELLPVLWELEDKIAPAEKVLFAAACFKALPEREKHPAFARRLDGELKAMITAPMPPGDTEIYSRLFFLSRAVGALASLWKGSDDEKEWIMRQAGNSRLDRGVRGEIIERLSEILGTRAEDETASSPGGTPRPDMLRWRQLSLPRSDRARLQKIWGGHDWVGELLMPLAKSREQHWEVRVQAAMAMRNMPGKDERIKSTLESLAIADNEHSQVRLTAIGGLLKIWGANDGMKMMLETITVSREESATLRCAAIRTLANGWKGDVSVRETLTTVVALTDDHTPVQRAALSALVDMGHDERLLQCLLKTATEHKAEWPLRKMAIGLLGQGAKPDAVARNDLLAMAKDHEERVSLRTECIRSLTRVSKKDEQIKAQITLLMQSAQEDEKVRIASFEALGLVWQRENNEWVKELLMPLVRPEEKCVALRTHILWFMPQLWRRQAWLQEFFKELSMSPDEPEPIHSVVIRASYNGDWRKADWFKQRLVSWLGDPAQPVKVRQDAIQVLVQIWRGESWVADLLLPIAASQKENPKVREQAIVALGSWVSEDDRGRALLLSLASTLKDVPALRCRAIQMLELHFRNIESKEILLLMNLAKSSTEEPTVREAAIDLLGTGWNLLAWDVRGDFLSELASAKEQNEKVRSRAAFRLAQVRASMEFGN